MTHEYELMVILDPEIDERTVAPSLDKFLNVIRNDGGTIDNIDIWGRRRLAYEIQKKSEGIYAVVNFTATSASTVELDRQLKLSEAVLRTKVLRSEEAVARAISVRAEDAKRAERKAAAAAKNPKAAAAAEAKPVKAEPVEAKPAKADADEKPAKADAEAKPAKAEKAEKAADEKPAKAPKAAKAEAPVEEEA
jgi:small subunit ribosomal protein S6